MYAGRTQPVEDAASVPASVIGDPIAGEEAPAGSGLRRLTWPCVDPGHSRSMNEHDVDSHPTHGAARGSMARPGLLGSGPSGVRVVRLQVLKDT